MLSDIKSSQNLREKLRLVAAQTLKPPPKMGLDEWADTYFYLSPEASAEAGKFSCDRAAYQREMFQACSDPTYEEVVFCTSAQIGKTTVLLALILYYIHQDPSPILLVQPTKELAGSFSKDRLAPAIRDTPVVKGLVSDAKGRDSNNTIMSKSFGAGVINLVGSNAPSSLASRPVRVALCDEVDRYPLSAGTEGDPLQLAIKRTSNFFNRKIIMVSTPTDELVSRIWARYEASDQRKYFIECVHCHESFIPKWEHVKWIKDAVGNHMPETAQLFCPHCGSGHNDAERNAAVRKGHWQKHNPTSKVAGFALSALISPWAVLEKLVIEWLSAQKDVQKLKTFFNTQLGEVWRDRSDNIDDLDFLTRVESYDLTELPNEIAVLTAGCDVQDDRIEASVYGYGEQNEIWHIEHQVFFGNPANPKTWKSLEDFLKTRYQRADGVNLPIAAAAIDSGGHFTNECYSFAKAHSQRRWWSIKGRSGAHPIWPSKVTYTKNEGKVYLIGVDSGKEAIYGWLKNNVKGPGYVHYSDRCDAEFFSQIASEKKVLTYRNGYTYYSWKKDPSRRNEALDCFVYSLAAKEGLNPSFKQIKKNLLAINEKKKNQHIEKANTEPETKPETKAETVQTEIKTELNKPVEKKKTLPVWRTNLRNRLR